MSDEDIFLPRNPDFFLRRVNLSVRSQEQERPQGVQVVVHLLHNLRVHPELSGPKAALVSYGAHDQRDLKCAEI